MFFGAEYRNWSSIDVLLFLMKKLNNKNHWIITLDYSTITWGAAINTAADKSTVKNEKAIRQTRSSTIAANFHSFSRAPASACNGKFLKNNHATFDILLFTSARILSDMTRISTRMEWSSFSMNWAVAPPPAVGDLGLESRPQSELELDKGLGWGGSPPGARMKSPDKSKTLASKDLEFLSPFSSSRIWKKLRFCGSCFCFPMPRCFRKSFRITKPLW